MWQESEHFNVKACSLALWLWNKVQITLSLRRCSVCGFKAIATPHYVKCCDAFDECAQWTQRLNSFELSLFIWSLTLYMWQNFIPKSVCSLISKSRPRTNSEIRPSTATIQRAIFLFISCLLNYLFQDTVQTFVISYRNLIQFGKREISSLNSVKRHFLGHLLTMQWFVLVSGHQPVLQKELSKITKNHRKNTTEFGIRAGHRLNAAHTNYKCAADAFHNSFYGLHGCKHLQHIYE